MKQLITFLLPFIGILAGKAYAANMDDPVLERGQEVYELTCATSYCHGPAGGQAGAPRLAAREFDALYIASVTANGVPDTPMVGFANALSAEDMNAVLTMSRFSTASSIPSFLLMIPLPRWASPWPTRAAFPWQAKPRKAANCFLMPMIKA